jgi:hypothetical protein
VPRADSGFFAQLLTFSSKYSTLFPLSLCRSHEEIRKITAFLLLRRPTPPSSALASASPSHRKKRSAAKPHYASRKSVSCPAHGTFFLACIALSPLFSASSSSRPIDFRFLCPALIFFPPSATRTLSGVRFAVRQHPPQQFPGVQNQYRNSTHRRRHHDVGPPSGCPDGPDPAAGRPAVLRQQCSIPSRGASHEQLASHQTRNPPDGPCRAASRC